MSEACERFRGALEELLDQQVSAGEAALLAEHLEECPECRGIQSARLHLRDMIRHCMEGDQVVPPPNLRARILISIHRRTQLRMRGLDAPPSGDWD